VLFFGLFCYFSVFFFVGPPKNFSVDALGATRRFCSESWEDRQEYPSTFIEILYYWWENAKVLCNYKFDQCKHFIYEKKLANLYMFLIHFITNFENKKCTQTIDYNLKRFLVVQSFN